MTHNSLDHLLTPASVAIIGASERRGSVGELTYRQLISGGFSGEVYVVNPGYETIHGAVSYHSVLEIPAEPDLTVLAVANHLLEEQMERSIERGTKSVAIFASGHGTASDGSQLTERIRALADEAGVPICGGNGMGFLNVEERVRVCGFYQPDLEPGGVTFISHSGSLFSAMLHNRRGIGFNLVVSSGMEINTTMDQYIQWALDRQSTKVIALFLETVRDPGGFTAALRRADDQRIPVVVLKVGSSPRGSAAVATHSQAMAGEQTTYQALFDHFGAHVVDSADEMLETIEVFASPRRATAPGLGAVHDSGGERAMLIDTAHRVGVALPDLSATTTTRLEGLLDPGLEPANPVDAWGTGRNAEEVFAETLVALGEDPSIGVVAFCVDLTTEERPDDAYSRATLRAVASTDKPVVVIANLSAAVDPTQASVLREGGIPVLEGTENALKAIRHLIADHLQSRRSSKEERMTRFEPLPEGPLSESATLRLLSGYGIDTPVSFITNTIEGALTAAEDIGYPVVIKTTGVGHKSDVGGVALNVANESALRAVVADFQHRLADTVVVANHVPKGVEISLGMYTDPQFGAVVLVGAGGVFVELFDDRIALIPPVDRDSALQAVDRLKIRALLDGARGTPKSNIPALAEAIVRFSEMVDDHRSDIASIDVNPLIVGPSAAVAVDALIERF